MFLFLTIVKGFFSKIIGFFIDNPKILAILVISGIICYLGYSNYNKNIEIANLNIEIKTLTDRKIELEKAIKTANELILEQNGSISKAADIKKELDDKLLQANKDKIEIDKKTAEELSHTAPNEEKADLVWLHAKAWEIMKWND